MDDLELVRVAGREAGRADGLAVDRGADREVVDREVVDREVEDRELDARELDARELDRAGA